MFPRRSETLPASLSPLNVTSGVDVDGNEVRDDSVAGLLVIGSSAYAQNVQVARSLPGFQCNALVHVWNGQGPMPPPVQEFAGPEQSAGRVGIAMSTLIVDDPPKTADGRTRVLRPNGKFRLDRTSVGDRPVARCKCPVRTLFGCSNDERDVRHVRQMMRRAVRRE